MRVRQSSKASAKFMDSGIVSGPALPAGGELALIALAAAPASPGSARRFGVLHVPDQGLRAVKVFVPEHPKLRKTLQKRDFPQATGELLVLDQARDAGLLQQIFHMAHMGQGLVCDQSFHGTAIRAEGPQENRPDCCRAPGSQPTRTRRSPRPRGGQCVPPAPGIARRIQRRREPAIVP